MKGCATMPLDQQHLVTILKDILVNQQMDCCGSVAECEQVGRLVKSLMVDEGIDNQTKDILQEIYSYCQKGINSTDLDQHIESHQQQLSQWVTNMDQLL